MAILPAVRPAGQVAERHGAGQVLVQELRAGAAPKTLLLDHSEGSE